MTAFTDVSKHDTGSLQSNSDRLAGTLTGHAPWLFAARVMIWICCSLAILYAHTPPCRAQNPADAADNQTLQVKFIGLKPGNTIGDSQLHLHDDNTLVFSIKDETLINTAGTWSTQTNRFSASIHFTVDRAVPFHYRLKLEGYHLLGLHAGRANLREYDRHKSLTQEIDFLFYAVPPKFFTTQTRAKEDDGQ